MEKRSGGPPFWGRAFTLIELLIVVAIIAILAMIAVPNFLEAQARAKISRAKTDLRTMHIAVNAYNAYMVDWNDCLRDANDTDSAPDLKNRTWAMEHPGETPDMLFTVGQGYYTLRQWRPLSTPVAYVTFQPIQGAFSHNVPYGQDTREYPSASCTIVYWVILCGGVDRTNGDWYRGNNVVTNFPNGIAVPYDPTNGTVSRGDIWRGEAFASNTLFSQEYGSWPMSP
jgi:prepilin-type N-terminal cleavage/methylation domain-containing protein